MKLINNISKISVAMITASVIFSGIVISSCTASKAVSAKSGAELWAENCQRCHNTPSPSTFSHEQWETIGMHMQTRALITDEEREKIVAFMKQSN